MMTPSAVSAAGGVVVTVSGRYLGNALTCTVGGTAAQIIANTNTRIEFIAPAKGEGTFAVVVTTPGGTSNSLSLEYAPHLLTEDGRILATESGDEILV